jgi:adenine-specific DNA-methyltransferase
VIYSKDWKDGKPVSREGSSHLFKYIRLESYEDTLNNLVLARNKIQADMLAKAKDFRESYMLGYMLDVETRGSDSLLNLDRFADPFSYTLKIATGSAGETKETAIDLVETFNYLIGLTVEKVSERESFIASFNTTKENENKAAVTIEGWKEEKNSHYEIFVKNAGTFKRKAESPWNFQYVEGYCWSKQRAKEKVLVVWRNLTGDIEKDNLMLDCWLKRKQIKTTERVGIDYDIIYVNGDNNLENLRRADETWKVRLIEEEFKRLMFEGKDV